MPGSCSRNRLWPGTTALAFLALGVVSWPSPTLAEPEFKGGGGADVACIIRIDGRIDALTERTLELRVQRAMEKHPRFLIISIESPGGDYAASRTIAWNLSNLSDRVETIAFIRGNALSGATIVAFGCSRIYMRPGSQMGDVLPISLDVMRTQPQVAEKMIAPVRKDMEQLAEHRNFPVDVAAAMVDPSVELHEVEYRDPKDDRIRSLWVSKEGLSRLPNDLQERIQKDRVVCEVGELLVISSEDAHRMGIAEEVPVGDDEDLCRFLGEHMSINRVVPDQVHGMWWEHVVRFITWWPVKLLLFVVGVIALIVALSNPGLGVPEVLAILCMGAVFFGSYMIGLADWIEVVLFAIGLVLIAIEVFATPGFGVLGVAGGLCVAAALLLSFQSFVVPANSIEWTILGDNLLKTALGCAVSLVGLSLTVRFLPRAGLFRRLVHEHTQTAPEPAAAVGLAPVGTTCTTLTTMRPVGKVSVGDEVFDARAEDGMLSEGTPVVVVGHSGAELVVAAQTEAKTASEPESG